MQISVLYAQPAIEHLQWTVAAKLPPVRDNEKALGLAGVFSGVSNNVLLVAGGSYFPDKMPWEGGKKDYVSNIFILQKTTNGRYTWLPGKRFLKQPAAYGASVSTPVGVVCVGGENQTANSIPSAFLLRWDAVNQNVVCKNLPDLPIPLTNACMAAIGSEVYVCGGESNGRPSAQAFSLNLAESNKGWKRLPDMPLAMSHSVAVAQSNGHNHCLYVIGGRSSSPAGISDLHSSAFCYNPLTNRWTAIQNIGDGVKINNLSASAGVALGSHQTLMVGGDRGEIFHRIETYNRNIAESTNEDRKKQLQAEKLGIVTHHPGFSRQILIYDTLTDQWKNAGQLPMESHVTTNALVWDGNIFITGGEVRPGIRTPDILKAKLPDDVK